jgi:hypothetical protein
MPTQVAYTKHVTVFDLNFSVVVYFSLLGLMLSLALVRLVDAQPLAPGLAG